MNFLPAVWGSDVSIYWHFPVFVVLVNLVYSGTRYDDWGQLLSHAFKGMIYIVMFLGFVFVLMFMLSSVLPFVF
jgi:hypothetical protein